jgi:hypothetical protein
MTRSRVLLVAAAVLCLVPLSMATSSNRTPRKASCLASKANDDQHGGVVLHAASSHPLGAQYETWIGGEDAGRMRSGPRFPQSSLPAFIFGKQSSPLAIELDDRAAQAFADQGSVLMASCTLSSRSQLVSSNRLASCCLFRLGHIFAWRAHVGSAATPMPSPSFSLVSSASSPTPLNY